MRKGKCKHFTGVSNKACKGGVVYEHLVQDKDDNWYKKLPCISSRREELRTGLVKCACYQEPTEEEIKKHQEELRQRLLGNEGCIGIGNKFREKCKDIPNRIRIWADCPTCKEKQTLIIDLHNNENGHMHLLCKNGCIKMME